MKTLQDLFARYLNNECSPEEVKQLLAHFNVQHNEGELRRLIAESLEGMGPEDRASEWNPAIDESYAAIKKKLEPEQVKAVPLYAQSWFKVAALVIVLAGGFTFYKAMNNKPAGSEIVTVDKSTEQINPGSNKAILTLANGSTIILQDEAEGTVAQEGGTKIEKQGGGLLTYTSVNENSEKELLNSVTTPRGGQYQVALSDGSKIWLNAASTLRFPAHFIGSERKVELSGEAYFEVAKNTTMPFKVTVAGKGEVEVLGTHFNVNAYDDEQVVKTTLLEGKVKIIAHASPQPLTLYPGQELQVASNGEISINKNADTVKTVAWKNGFFSFNNADMKTILRQLSRWYNVDIQFEGSVPERKFTGDIQRDWKWTQVLKLLERYNVPFRVEGKTLIILK